MMTHPRTQADSPTKTPARSLRKGDSLPEQLEFLKLPFMREHYENLAKQAAANHWTHLDYLARLIEGEAAWHEDRSIGRRVKLARFPVLKTLEQFQWSWPRKINRPQIQNLFRLAFIEEKSNVIFLSGVGTGKSHLSIALAHSACLRGYSVLFSTAIDIINVLTLAHTTGALKHALHKYVKPTVLVIDELGYLPIDKNGADLLFQIISARYERGAIIISSNRAYKHWPEIFNNDSTLTSALLDRLLHHAETILIEGKSCRMKDRVEPPA
jgi:DNA replication protein DnaC